MKSRSRRGIEVFAVIHLSGIILISSKHSKKHFFDASFRAACFRKIKNSDEAVGLRGPFIYNFLLVNLLRSIKCCQAQWLLCVLTKELTEIY